MPDFEISAGTLTVNRDLQSEFEEDFKAKCNELLESPEEQVVLDLSGVGYMRSYHLSISVNLFLDAQERGKSLKIIVSPKIEKLFDMAGLLVALDVEVAG